MAGAEEAPRLKQEKAGGAAASRVVDLDTAAAEPGCQDPQAFSPLEIGGMFGFETCGVQTSDIPRGSVRPHRYDAQLAQLAVEARAVDP